MRKQTKKLVVNTETVRSLVRPLETSELQVVLGAAGPDQRCCSRCQSGCIGEAQ